MTMRMTWVLERLWSIFKTRFHLNINVICVKWTTVTIILIPRCSLRVEAGQSFCGSPLHNYIATSKTKAMCGGGTVLLSAGYSWLYLTACLNEGPHDKCAELSSMTKWPMARLLAGGVISNRKWRGVEFLVFGQAENSVTYLQTSVLYRDSPALFVRIPTRCACQIVPETYPYCPPTCLRWTGPTSESSPAPGKVITGDT